MDVKRLVVMGVLLVGLVWAATSSPLSKRLFGGSTARRAPAPVGALEPISELSAPQAAAPAPGGRPLTPSTPLAADELERWRERHATAGQRDPFFTGEEERAMAAPKVAAAARTDAPAAPLPTYTVKAIMISEGTRVAALDGGRLISEGEPIGEERVVEIRADGVILERGGQRRRLSLPGGSAIIEEIDRAPKAGKRP